LHQIADSSIDIPPKALIAKISIWKGCLPKTIPTLCHSSLSLCRVKPVKSWREMSSHIEPEWL